MNNKEFLLFLILKLYILLITLIFRYFFPSYEVISKKDKSLTTFRFLGPNAFFFGLTELP